MCAVRVQVRVASNTFTVAGGVTEQPPVPPAVKVIAPVPVKPEDVAVGLLPYVTLVGDATEMVWLALLRVTEAGELSAPV
jgi:hypothetical protein